MRFHLTLIAGAFVLVLSLGQLLVFRTLNSIWWHRKPLRLISLGLVAFTLVAAVLWSLSSYLREYTLSYVFATAASLAAILNLALLVSLPLSGVINTTYYWWQRIRAKNKNTASEAHSDESAVMVKPEEVQPEASPRKQRVSKNRRLVLQGAAAIFPVSAVALGSGGMTEAFATANVRKKEFYYPNLPDDLDGLKIFHVSDSHLGPYVDNDDMEALMLRAEPYKPDIVVYSGDVADDLRMLPGCIELVEGLKAKYGAYASMGNHDYYRGAPQVKAHFARSSIPMLINEGVHLKIGKSEVYIGGADDPRRIGVPVWGFLKDTVERTLAGAHSDAFKVIMTHRPNGFNYTAQHGVELTVAGHTHGAQIGFMGRSVFSEWGGERYLWGEYRIGASRLYTSSGVGHWFPFRLGCPTEAPIIVLRKGKDPHPAQFLDVSKISRQITA